MYYPPDGEPSFTHPNLQLVAGDMRDRESLRRALGGISVVYHIAALYRPTNVRKRDYREVNIDGTRTLLELAAAEQVDRFVHCSTIGVHGHVENPPADEHAPLKPDDYYQYTKLRGEELARDLGSQLGLRIAVVRPAAIYGPLEPRFLKLARLIGSGRFVMFGSGEVLYHFIHIDDLCAAFVLCAERPEAVGNTYIIADDHAITLNQIVQIVSAATHAPLPRRRLPLSVLMVASVLCEFACKPLRLSPPLHRRRAEWFWATRSFDITRARNDLGYQPHMPVERGLTEMVHSYCEAGWI